MELVGRYSNPDEWAHLSDTTRVLAEPAIGASDDSATQPSGSKPWPIIDRLGKQTLQELLSASSAGVMQHVLAERYDISLSSVKRILRRGRADGPASQVTVSTWDSE